MTLITANGISKSFGDLDVFSDVSLSVPPKARIGFVGDNGSGKTTLLKILVGLDEPDTGIVSRSKNLSIGYLPQQIEIASDKTPYESCLESFSDLIEAQNQLNRIEEELLMDPENKELLANYGRLQEDFENRGGYIYRSKINQILQGLGLIRGEEHRPWMQLSGGQKIRAYLAKILVSDPDLLILDEPTNHLDINSIEWLESYLHDFPGGVLMVSHDRYFLDQCVNTVWEMSYSFEVYHGNYSAYLQQREERYQRQLLEYEKQQEFIAKEEEYIRRNIAGQNTRQAQGRRKRLETLLSESKIIKPTESRSMHLKLNTDLRSGDLVLRTHDLAIGYQDDKKVLFNVPDLTLIRGECASIIGPNGTGKSTFLKTILEKMPPLSGETKLGANLKVGYFAQAHEDLDPESDIMDEISKAAPNMLPAQIRDYLAKYLFSGDDVFKKVRVLSGGEKGRLALAILALRGANLLLLDEPMNHLDIDAQELLQSVLKSFEGTIILVSHDRYLIDAVGTQIWEVFPEKKSLSVYNGTYSQYKEYKKQLAAPSAPVSVEKTKTVKSPDGEKKKLSNGVIWKLTREREALEEKISSLENEVSELSAKINSGSLSYDEMTSLGVLYNKKQAELDELFESWSEIEMKLNEG
ncbi:MAG: ABC-F family ATP-binding cassette domain-containing protein [Anaerolineaceae bacterium]|nr:ABC-F family ATP-binding cassette domain-containing protein [Anaerolineaceae bacterium]